MMDLLLIWGIILAPMTALRVFKFGPGEILLIIWMVAVLANNRGSTENRGALSIEIDKISRYQIANLVVMFVGMIANMLLYGYFPSARNLTDFPSHLFMLLFVIQLTRFLKKKSLTEIKRLLSRIVILGAITYAIDLFYATYISDELFGIRLWMMGRSRFLGLALNPHQIEMISATSVFFALFLAFETVGIKKKIVFLVAALVWFWVSLSTKSDTMILCYIICFTYIFFGILVSAGKGNSEIGYKNFWTLALTCSLVIILASPLLYYGLRLFIINAQNGNGRFEIWASSWKQLTEKPLGFLVGLGPGGLSGFIMSTGSEAEAHNTYIQLCLNSGILICIYYIITIVGIIKKPHNKNVFLVSAVLFFLCCGCGGNMNRKVLAWFTYVICAVLFERISEERKAAAQ